MIVPVTQLPVDLQNQVRAGAGFSVMSHRGTRDLTAAMLAGLAIILGAAGIAAGVFAVIAQPSTMLDEPRRWVPLIAGATLFGAMVGQLLRMDLRPRGLDSVVVGSTCLVVARRDAVVVYPAERIQVQPYAILFDGREIDRGYRASDFTDALQAAIRAAADPARRADDRWCRAALGRPAPIRRWTPIVHGAVLGFALALALEAGPGSRGRRDHGDWAALADRARAFERWTATHVTQRREQRGNTLIAELGQRDTDHREREVVEAIVRSLRSNDTTAPAVGTRLRAAFAGRARARLESAGDVPTFIWWSRRVKAVKLADELELGKLLSRRATDLVPATLDEATELARIGDELDVDSATHALLAARVRQLER